MKPTIIKHLKSKTTKSQSEIVSFSRVALEREIIEAAKSLQRPEKSSEQIAKRVSREVEKWLDERKKITKKDINLETAKKLEKYDKDLSYIFKNRDIII